MGLYPNLVVGPQAAGTQVDTLCPPLYIQTYAVNVGHLAHVRRSLGVADVVAEHAFFSAHSTLGHGVSLENEPGPL